MSEQVTQADRDAAADALDTLLAATDPVMLSPKEAERVIHEAFARHRIEATRQLEADKAELVEAAYREGYSDAGNSYTLQYNWEWSEAREALAKHGTTP